MVTVGVKGLNGSIIETRDRIVSIDQHNAIRLHIEPCILDAAI